MDEFVFFITGDVEHPLTIDPTVWIFDERKVDLDTYFDQTVEADDEETAYKKAISAQWDKEITEGSSPPRMQSNGNEIKYNKQKLMNGSFGIPLKPFLLNSRPMEGTDQLLVISADDQEHLYSITEAVTFIVGFCKEGKPLTEDGPVHLYHGDGSNKHEPISSVSNLILKLHLNSDVREGADSSEAGCF